MPPKRPSLTDRPAGAWPPGVACCVLEQVDSTNAEAMRRASGLTGPTWIMARWQTAGRGRRGRAWTDPPGNFAATLLLHPQGGPAAAARYSFVAALAVHDALRALCGPHPVLALKWPNDVLLNGGKLSGILLEGVGSGASIQALAIGIGINLLTAPGSLSLEPDALHPVSLLGETGLTVTPDEMLPALAMAFAEWQARMEAEGFEPIRRAWLARAARLGDTITARSGATRTTGRFEGIDDSGALVLTGPRGRQVIPAADIFFTGA